MYAIINLDGSMKHIDWICLGEQSWQSVWYSSHKERFAIGLIYLQCSIDGEVL